jgi:hypothetical protein
MAKRSKEEMNAFLTDLKQEVTDMGVPDDCSLSLYVRHFIQLDKVSTEYHAILTGQDRQGSYKSESPMEAVTEAALIWIDGGEYV